MPFNITSYIHRIQSDLEAMPKFARTGFAIWCANTLFEEARDYLSTKIDCEQLSSLEQAIEYLWKCASGQTPNIEQLSRLEAICSAIDWDPETVAADDEVINVFAIEAISALSNSLETCRTGSALSAARSAENVLNKLDWQLSNELCVDNYSEDVWSARKWNEELEVQRRMLDFLAEAPRLDTRQKTLFRS